VIFFYSNQTGTTLYFKSYKKKKNKYFIFTNKKKFNLISNLKNHKKILNFEDIILFIKKFNPNFFYISATKDKIEDQIIKNSNRFNYKVISIIDYPTNLKITKRFVSKNKNLLPKKIYVPDIQAKNKMIKFGYPAEKLFIIRNPYFKDIKKIKKKSNNKRKILLVDQNFPHVNYSTYLKKLKKNLLDKDANLKIDIREHPENLKNKKVKKIFIKETFQENFRFLNNYSHVIGHSSTLMNIAILKGLNVLSYNPFNKKDFNCPLFERGLIKESKKFKDIITFINLNE
jgi:hypothetical protein